MPSIIDQRLAAEMHKRQIEALVKAEGVANRVAGGIQDAADRWIQVIATDADISIRLRVASRLWYSHFMQIAPTIDDQFRRLIGWSHAQQVQVYASVIPRRWFRKVSPEVAVMTNLEDIGRTAIPGRQVIIPGQQVGPLSGDDLRANVFTEPIADSTERMSDEEWQRVLSEVVFKPPSRAEVELMLHTKGPDGISWQGRFENLSRRISDIDRMSQELIVGFANGENLQQLKKRALPLVEGIQASAKRIVRTEGLRIAEQVQRRSWDGLGDMMQGAQVLAVLDQNTRPEHAARNGTIYYEQPRAGQKSMAELPMLPDQPNCRCWSTPVLKPPKELENDPEIAAAFANDAGAGIPDPASYDKWFETADPERRMMAVGARRYRAVEDMLRGLRNPEWTDFIDTDGQLLPVSKIKGESAAERAERKYEVGEVIRQRGEQVKAIAAKGFLVQGDIGPAGPRPVLPPGLPPPPRPPVSIPPVVPPRIEPRPVVPPPPAPVVIPASPLSPAIGPAEPIPPRPEVPRFEIPPEAKTLKEAERLAIKYNLADKVSYKKFDLAVANEMNRTIAQNLQAVPQLRKQLQFVGSAQERNKQWIKFQVDKAVEEVRKQNPDYTPTKEDLKRLQSNYRFQATRMFKVGTSDIAQSLGYHHKIAHPFAGITINEKAAAVAGRIDELASRNVRVGFNPPGCGSLKAVIDHEMGHQVDNLLGLFNGPGSPDSELQRKLGAMLTPSSVSAGLSRYAATTKDEIISEAWAEYRNNPAPRQIATIVGQHIEERLRNL